MNSYCPSNLENHNADQINNLYNEYIAKDSHYDDTSSEKGGKYSENEYNNFCQDAVVPSKKIIFKTEKTRRHKKNFNNIDKVKQKQIRNRMAAKKCRDNKKSFMNNLLIKLKHTEDELKKYKQLYQQSKTTDVYTNVTNNYNLIHNVEFQINYENDENKMVKIYKELLYNIIPLNIRDYVINFLDLSDVSNCESIKSRINDFRNL
jgi:hypothetical protein